MSSVVASGARPEPPAAIHRYARALHRRDAPRRRGRRLDAPPTPPLPPDARGEDETKTIGPVLRVHGSFEGAPVRRGDNDPVGPRAGAQRHVAEADRRASIGSRAQP